MANVQIIKDQQHLGIYVQIYKIINAPTYVFQVPYELIK